MNDATASGWIGQRSRLVEYAAAVAGPALLSGVLLVAPFGNARDYAFLYVGVVAVLGVASGSGPAFVAAALSFLTLDYLFVPPLHTLTIANSEDVVNLVVFFAAAGLVGTLGSRRRAAQMRAEALAGELQRANIELARLNREQAEAARLAAQLAETERQVHVLEETDRLRHELLANVSHELRTPLGAILTGSTVIGERPDLPPRLRDELQGISAEARRLNRLVSDMLDMTRIEGSAIELHIDEVDMRDAVRAAQTRLRAVTPGARVRVTIPRDLPAVAADWDRLGQILDNLLVNAARHGGDPGGAPIEVSATTAGDVVELHIRDHGPGIPEALRPRIFDRFVRGPQAHAAEGGTGLGLAIVRGLVDAQNGHVCVTSPTGGGAEFVVALPAIPADDGGPSDAEPQ